MITLLLYTNSRVLEKGFLSIFTNENGFRIHTARGPLAGLLRTMDEISPGILLFDFAAAENFPDVAEVRRHAPGCGIVLWVDTISIEAGYQAMKLGVRGILQKCDDIDHAIDSLAQVAEGRMCFDQSLVTHFLESRTVGLTPRESQLVPLVVRGLKNREIASALELSEATVRIYLSALFRKLGVRDRHELAIYAMKNLPSGDASRYAGPVLHSMMMGKAATIPFAGAGR
jgi:DNA-binding NarL/FixJ family response regulator